MKGTESAFSGDSDAKTSGLSNSRERGGERNFIERSRGSFYD